MEQRLSVITLGVRDLGTARAFYTEVLGWTPFYDKNAVVFFDLGGFVLGLYAHDSLAGYMGLPAGQPQAPYHGFSLAYNARTRAKVDDIFRRLTERGVRILKAPENAFWGGYFGHFADADGHAWEVAYNPQWPVMPDGRLRVGKG
jgi:catechol 2,3-dioxygenase-like lactoylglutathione lyase family enzyme